MTNLNGIYLEGVKSSDVLDLLHDIQARLERIEVSMTAKAAAANDNDFLTQKEVATMFNINLSTVWQWQRKGILTKYNVGKRAYYKRGEVQAAFDNGKIGR
jgi:DNA invertase Pin-like site-specific DNA recombinase